MRTATYIEVYTLQLLKSQFIRDEDSQNSSVICLPTSLQLVSFHFREFACKWNSHLLIHAEEVPPKHMQPGVPTERKNTMCPLSVNYALFDLPHRSQAQD
jgi:hypothetical protein